MRLAGELVSAVADSQVAEPERENVECTRWQLFAWPVFLVDDGQAPLLVAQSLAWQIVVSFDDRGGELGDHDPAVGEAGAQDVTHAREPGADAAERDVREPASSVSETSHAAPRFARQAQRHSNGCRRVIKPAERDPHEWPIERVSAALSRLSALDSWQNIAGRCWSWRQAVSAGLYVLAMFSAAEVITVDVVTNLWTDAVLPIAAIVISVGTLIWSIRDRQRDHAQIRISSGISIPLWTPGPAERLIGIDVTNIGHSGTTVLSSINLRAGRHGGNLWVVRPAHGVGPTYPARLEPGQNEHLLVDPKGVALTCLNEGISPESLLVVVKTGHGESSAPLNKGTVSLISELMHSSAGV